jgi:hypothetical protein
MLMGVFPRKADLEALQRGMLGTPADAGPLIPETPPTAVVDNHQDDAARGYPSNPLASAERIRDSPGGLFPRALLDQALFGRAADH